MSTLDLPNVLSFEWDAGNKEKNWIKHIVTKEEAEEAFYDRKKLLLEDSKHSSREARSILFGKTKKGRILFIVYTIRNDCVRIISARDLNKKEVKFYEKAISSTKL